MSRITGSESVYQAVFSEIQSEVLQAGDPLREDVLARKYNLSRTPVREALRRLVQDGLCERHGAGLRVSRPTLEQVHQIYPIVAVLEGLAARLCAEGMNAAILRRLEVLHADMHERSRTGDHAGYVKLNQLFHDVIQEASSNITLTATIQRLRLITLALRRYQLGIGSRMHQSSAEHEDLMDALRKRDGAAAEEAMRRHVDAGHRILVTALSLTPLFEPQEQALPQDNTTNHAGSHQGNRQTESRIGE